MVLKGLRLLLGVLAACGLAARASADPYTITGTILTPIGPDALANAVPVKYIRVFVMADDPILGVRVENFLGSYTDESGRFSIEFDDRPTLGRLFIDVEYVGMGLNGRVIEVRVADTDSSPIRESHVEEPALIPKLTNVSSGVIDLGELHVRSTRANAITQVENALRYLRSRDSDFVQSEDVRVEARPDGFVPGKDDCPEACAADIVTIAFIDYASSTNFSVIHHELFHWIDYRARGKDFPGGCELKEGHSENSESCPGFAIVEGAAEYFQGLSAPPDTRNVLPPPETWRGVDHNGANNAGDIVEGALWRIWAGLNNPPDILKIILSKHPSGFEDFKTEWLASKGSGSTATLNFFDLAAENGIVYTRLAFKAFARDGTPFAEEAPPSSGPPTAGNFAVLDGTAFLRGKVTPILRLLTEAELKLAAGSKLVEPTQRAIGYKPAANDLEQNYPALIFTFLPMVAKGQPIVFDTTLLPDADYDLIARARNPYGFEDNFKPTSACDPAVDLSPCDRAYGTDEQHFKALSTWFSLEGQMSDKAGKVIVDNTPPTISNMKPAR